MKFKKAIGHNDLFYIDDKELDVKDVIIVYFIYSDGLHVCKTALSLFIDDSTDN